MFTKSGRSLSEKKKESSTHLKKLEDIEINSSDKDDEWRKVDDEVEIPKYSFDKNKQGTQISKADRPATNLEHFQLFLTEAILNKIVLETNKYANKKSTIKDL
ncbi:hypothetical protein BB559_006381 [Furculomyces boomerangus]|uniref:Uncharacterized protein n=1 Tax=Furculomyces boomerangus TaxID=61424 RepID=A0A2T9Y3G1_9FUNG|nr:hypothetical protein BB559_006381 [Furculomyces boomerangus]